MSTLPPEIAYLVTMLADSLRAAGVPFVLALQIAEKTDRALVHYNAPNGTSTAIYCAIHDLEAPYASK